ncbi:hypothetical protein niasHT_008204 [Heterodera trifolii]|uniref:Cilia- and flagella-associated protein 36 n=1 Tax=Heterodera trifolii TaxID=157864 RepID=A0ABD2LVG3_9BILA
MFSRRSSMTVKEEQIFDSFINFLRSELWQISINEFIEQRSIVFERDSNVGDASTSDDTYHSLYGEYRKIVHDLLDAHCSDGGTTRDELMKTLKSIEQIKNLSQKEQKRKNCSKRHLAKYLEKNGKKKKKKIWKKKDK